MPSNAASLDLLSTFNMSRKSIFDESESKPISAPKPKSIFSDVPDNLKKYIEPQKMMKTETLPEDQLYYNAHPSLKGKSTNFIKKVAEIDKTTNLTSAMNVLAYGDDVQSNIGKLLETVSSEGASMVSLGLTDVTEQIVAQIRGLSIDKFTGSRKTGWFSKKQWLVRDYVDAFSETVTKVNSLIDDLNSRSVSVMSMVNSCDSLFTKTDLMVEELDAYITAGHFIIDKNRKKLFRERNDEFLEAQFEDRINAMATYETLCLISFEQVKLTQHTLMKMAVEAKNVVSITYPLWKSAFSTLISKWQNKGSLSLDSSIDEMVASELTEYRDVEKHMNIITGSLSNQVINQAPPNRPRLNGGYMRT